jgi:hypothetical protein
MVGSTDRGSSRAIAGSRALQPDDFSFHGFGALSRDEMRKIMRLGIRDGQPDVSIVDDVIFVPGGFESGADQPKFAGGSVSSDGQPIGLAQMHRKGGKRFGGLTEPVAVEPAASLDEEVIYLGHLFNHYGRVLLESLARVWFLRDADPNTRVVFNTANSAQAGQAPWLPRLLEAFGVPPERILNLDRPTRLRRSIVPEPLFEQFYSAHAGMVRPFREYAERVAGDVEPSDQPLYLSRRRLSSRQRPVVGEAQLEDLLRQNGFRIAYPETMSLEAQVRLVNEHNDIVSTVGSAAHNVLFSLHQPRLHLLASRDDVPANYFLCSALVDAPTTLIDCLGSGGRTTPNDDRLARREGTRGGGERRTNEPDAGPQSMPQLIDLDVAADYLSREGFLKTAPAISGDALVISLRGEFSEAWMFARLRKAAGRADSLPADLEAEANAMASHSWPISLMLARFFARARKKTQAETAVRQFIQLFSGEDDPERIAYYRGDIEGIAQRVARICAPATNLELKEVLANKLDAVPTESGSISLE